MDLRARYLGLELRSLLVATALPLTGDLDGLRRLDDYNTGLWTYLALAEKAKKTGPVRSLQPGGAVRARARPGPRSPQGQRRGAGRRTGTQQLGVHPRAGRSALDPAHHPLPGQLADGPPPGPVQFVMQRKMMLGIKQRAEGTLPALEPSGRT
jgi:hypothetical protein